MIKAWELTRKEFMALSPAQRAEYTDKALGALPHNSNYHLCAVLQAIQEGQEVREIVKADYLPAISHMDLAVRMQTLTPVFDYANLSDRVTRSWVQQVKECARMHMERWADKGVNEAFGTYKVSVECFDAEGRRIGGQKLFKLRTPEAQLKLMTYLQTERNEFVNIPA